MSIKSQTRPATRWTRRGFMASATALSACSTASISSSRGEIDTRVDQALIELYQTIPGAQELANLAVGMLIMPRVNEAGFVGGAAYGEGALLIGNAKVDYYSVAGASIGFQIGAQRYKHALLFMTNEALAGFRAADGWEVGIDAEYAVLDKSAAVTVTTGTYDKPVYALIYGQEGIIFGATVEGNKYSRIVR